MVLFLILYRNIILNAFILDNLQFREEALSFKKHGFDPDIVLEIGSTDQKLNCNEIAQLFKKKYSILKCKNETDIHKICFQIRHKIKNINVSQEDITFGWCLRIIIIGRRGSGCRYQATKLASSHNLINIDVEVLIQETLAFDESPLGSIMRNEFETHEYSSETIAAILIKRLLMPDCLSNGWVIVGFPNTKYDVEIMFSEIFLLPPNKIIFIHTKENVCWKRLMKKIDKFPQYGPNYIKIEIDFFNKNIRDVFEAIQQFHRVIHINGNHSTSTVTTEILARVNQIQRK